MSNWERRLQSSQRRVEQPPADAEPEAAPVGARPAEPAPSDAPADAPKP